jgi:uncharacterized protein YjbJ (UPF0337 family)
MFFQHPFIINNKIYNMPEPSRDDATKNKIIGTAKEVLGTVGQIIPGVDGDKLKTEGQVQQKEGDAEYEAAKSKDKAASVKNEIKGTVKDKIGGLFGSEEMQQEGKGDQAKADVMDAKSKV